LAVRVIGEITKDRLDTLRECDAIFLEELRRAGLSGKIWQSFAVWTGVSTVGVMGDGRTYAGCVALRAVVSDDAMTVEAAEIPYPVLKKITLRIIGRCPASTGSSMTSPPSRREPSSGSNPDSKHEFVVANVLTKDSAPSGFFRAGRQSIEKPCGFFDAKERTFARLKFLNFRRRARRERL
jgi:hypothetical protein